MGTTTALQDIVYVWLLVSSLFSSLSAGLDHRRLEQNDTNYSEFDWKSIIPTDRLIYHDCFSNFQCARVLVPLAWQEKENFSQSESIALAVIKLPAIVAPSNRSYAGPIFVNPGGPGVSGIDFLVSTGQILQDIVDSNTSHFDIISFDPRGIGLSEPNLECFSDPIERASWHLSYEASSTLGTSYADVRMPWARAKILGYQCSRNGVGHYFSSVYVAHDLLQLLDMESSTAAKADTVTTDHIQRVMKDDVSVGNSINGNAMPALQYIGFSYGTLLGATFATMYPDRVKRMLLDGVIDTDHFGTDYGNSSVLDADQVLDYFCSVCYRSGPDCPMFNDGGHEMIRQDVDDILRTVDSEPLVVTDEDRSMPPEVLTGRDLRKWVFSLLYTPQTTFLVLAKLLHVIKHGQNSQILLTLLRIKKFNCPLSPVSLMHSDSLQKAATYACGDSQDMTNSTVAEFTSHLQRLESRSQLAGALLAELRLYCGAWTARPLQRLREPIGSKSSNTQPIFWMSNRLDPITPIENAYHMADLFANSAVLEQDSVGHCALFNSPSNCTIDAVKEYFATGKPPSKRMKCPSEQWTKIESNWQAELNTWRLNEKARNSFLYEPKFV